MDTPYNRAGRPRKAVRDSLRGLVASDYEKLLQACIVACVEHAGKNNYPVVEVAFHYLTKFADDFPIGWPVREEGPVNIRRIKARRLLEWLYKHGYTKLTVDDIAAVCFQLSNLERNLLNGLE